MTPTNNNLAAIQAREYDVPEMTARFDRVFDRAIGKPVGSYNDRGPFVGTYTGRFYPFSPRASEVRIEDIAHGLAMSSRYGGAGKRYYSTAEHSVHIARWLLQHYGRRAALAGLLHDAPEALSGFGDVTRPVKDRVPLIGKVESEIWGAVAAAFGLSPLMPEEVHEADSRIVADEMSQNHPEVDDAYNDPLGVVLQFWTPEEAEDRFIETFIELTMMQGRMAA